MSIDFICLIASSHALSELALSPENLFGRTIVLAPNFFDTDNIFLLSELTQTSLIFLILKIAL